MEAGQDGNYNGQGTMMYPDGWKHIGEWKDNKRNGQGAFTFSDVELSVGYGKRQIYQGKIDKDTWCVEGVVEPF
jgi:hypothetical protein